jgi:hypothetical protein
MASNRITTALVLACAFGAAVASARGAGLVAMESGPIDFSGAIGGHTPSEGRILQLIKPGSYAWFANDDFPASEYDISCDTPYVIARVALPSAAPGAAPPTDQRVCRIVRAPVVGAGFVATLERIGYEYEVSYPFADSGTGRGLIFWSDGGAQRGMAPAHQGFARIEGVGWQNQFAPAARCQDTAAQCAYRYFEHGDSFGAFINRFPSPDREGAARVFQQVGIASDGKVVAGASVVIDPWLATRGPFAGAGDVE